MLFLFAFRYSSKAAELLCVMSEHQIFVIVAEECVLRKNFALDLGSLVTFHCLLTSGELLYEEFS